MPGESTNKRLRAIVAEIENGGGTVISVTKSKHLKVKFVNPQGLTLIVVAAVSPSDWRAQRAHEKTMKKLMAKKAFDEVCYAQSA